MASQIERILILAKTYPSPSAQHVETSCVAGINEQGAMRRLYPLPFRLIEEGQKLKKWQWIPWCANTVHFGADSLQQNNFCLSSGHQPW